MEGITPPSRRTLAHIMRDMRTPQYLAGMERVAEEARARFEVDTLRELMKERGRSRSRSPLHASGAGALPLEGGAQSAEPQEVARRRPGGAAISGFAGSLFGGNRPAGGLQPKLLNFGDGLGSGMQYQPREYEDDLVPPGLQDCRQKEMQAYMKLHGEIKPWNEKVDKVAYAMQWFDSCIAYAVVSNVDGCVLVQSRLSWEGKQWLTGLLPTKSYHFWASGNYAHLRAEFRRRYAFQVRSEAVVALDTIVTGMYMHTDNLDVYVSKFEHQVRLAGGLITMGLYV